MESISQDMLQKLNAPPMTKNQDGMPTCAFLPTPPLNLLKGTICFLAMTSFRYLEAFLMFMCFIAWAVSLVFWNK